MRCVQKSILPIILILIGAQAAFAAAAPTITFNGSKIVASDVTRGATVVFFGVGIQRVDFSDLAGRWTKALTDDDRDGVVTYDFGQPVQATTVWVVVDLTNNHYAIAAPGHSIPAARLSAAPFHRGKTNQVDTFSLEASNLEMLYVHPGHGAWVVSARDGGKTDRDDRRAATGVSLEDAVSVLPDGESKPKEFIPGGLLFAVEWYQMSAVVIRLDGATLGGAQ